MIKSPRSRTAAIFAWKIDHWVSCLPVLILSVFNFRIWHICIVCIPYTCGRNDNSVTWRKLPLRLDWVYLVPYVSRSFMTPRHSIFQFTFFHIGLTQCRLPDSDIATYPSTGVFDCIWTTIDGAGDNKETISVKLILIWLPSDNLNSSIKREHRRSMYQAHSWLSKSYIAVVAFGMP